MPRADVNGIGIHYEDHGQGYPLIWSHEFAGDHRSWEAQVRFFSRRYRVITYNARGYPPSDVPAELDAYTQDQSVSDLHGLMVSLGIGKAHVGGLSMGGAIALNFGLTHPDMARSLIVAGAGSGSVDPEVFRERVSFMAERLRGGGMAAMDDYTNGPARVQLLRKDPKGYAEFRAQFLEHSNIGSAHTFAGVQGRRPPIFDLEDKMRALTVPTLIMTGDEDDPCIEPSIFMKRMIPNSGLVVIPQSGHPINLEEPDLFNRAVLDFLTAVESGAWATRDHGREAGALV
ncbi:MAG: alpha/beta hydrolase [SAR202 cluster bacterium]|jgi:pimeloyl-ACP methyl ester carboxylesterase|nr:alpha/beta hydrolase [SAR202 cluster bacterium]